MAYFASSQREGVAQIAGRILAAGRGGQTDVLTWELEAARLSAGRLHATTTHEMERMEVLAGVVEALRFGYDERSGAVRLLEHLAAPAIREEVFDASISAESTALDRIAAAVN